MNSDPDASTPRQRSCGDSETHTQLLLLPDGRILAHNLTPAMAQLLQLLNPQDRLMARRRLLAHAQPPSA